MVIVDACTLHAGGGSPTAVFDDDPELTDAARRDLVRRAGTSHAAFLTAGDTAAVRFFTAQGELVNCGHGTIAAQAVLLTRRGATAHRGGQLTGGRVVAVEAVRCTGGVEVWFDQGTVDLRPAEGFGGIVAALGLRPADVGDDPCVASPGTPRLLLPVRATPVLSSIRPDLDRLAIESRRLGLLGCFVYAPGSAARVDAPAFPARMDASSSVARVDAPGFAARVDVPGFAARMFAPAIGVAEDVVNANSAGCLAAHLAAHLAAPHGTGRIDVHQGAALGRPSLVHATATVTATGVSARVGGVAVVRR
jgi:trans-2,3-dihydro-3-hydroxyanthranilate isomerase